MTTPAIIRWFQQWPWQIGTCSDREARRNRVTGEVQFWHEKLEGDGENSSRWMTFDKSHWDGFEVAPEKAK